MKDFKTLDEQIELLKERKLSFDNVAEAKSLLLNNNYYNVINGYKDLFLEKRNPEMYKKGTKFDEVFALYEFDRQLRNVF